MPIVIKELVITLKTNEERQPPVTRLRKEARAQAQQQGQDALVREAVEQTLEILNRKNER
ncbi:hypothetical protein CLV84_0882 [Neolewinella xylanilytica]|uniref:Uncharacterized protein n=1 Tax=Neolewinella xylanilytica TaxID=1514080 RepID=A0A2S6I8V9_9BACT|nr:DUF5908 family protein [Neolewinella xylanilytica]PPK87923.1 hypothetical protein CLV84_0882 [Neolewinella xylanilytica]